MPKENYKNHLQTDESYRGRSRTFKHKAAVLVYKGQLLLRCNLDLQLLNNMYIGAGTIKTPFPIGSCMLTVILALGCLERLPMIHWLYSFEFVNCW